MTLSIIIVNYNGYKYLLNCILSIQEMCDGINHEIIVVDNASQDSSVELLKNRFNNEIILIESSNNLGFAKGNNKGVKHSKGQYILLLNNDTILLDNLKPLIDIFKDKSVGVVSIKMLGKDKEYRYSAGYFPSPTRLLKLSRLYIKNNKFKSGNFKKEHYSVDWVEGSFMLTTRKIWETVKGLDEDYFMYVEDVDFCKKVNLLNFRTIYYPKLRYIHFGGYGASRENLLKQGFIIYIDKHLNEPIKTLSKLSVFTNFTFKKLKKTVT